MITLKSWYHAPLFNAANDTARSISNLKRFLLVAVLFNFLVLSIAGVLLRAFFLFDISFPDYKNLLHGHSHFAFGGWVMPALILLVMHYFPELTNRIGYKHLRNIIALALISAYGMLASFPIQGYGVISIVFSTFSMIAGSYFGIAIWRTAGRNPTLPQSFLLAGIFYYFLSSIGPFATGPLTAMGKAGSPLYFNAIYFYLHFQYNGFFTFFIIATLYKRISSLHHGKYVYWLLNLSCIPSFALSLLWNHPSWYIYVIGGIAAVLQLAAIVIVVINAKPLYKNGSFNEWLFRSSMIALMLKGVIQVLSSFRFFADLGFQQRNLLIAYLHLVLLGFISVYILSVVAGLLHSSKLFRTGVCMVIIAFITTESLLLLQSIKPGLAAALFYTSTIFPAGLLLVVGAVLRKTINLKVFLPKHSYRHPQRQPNP